MKFGDSLIALALVAGLAGQLSAAASAEGETKATRELLIGRWTAEIALPNGIRLRDDQKIRSDGFAAGRIVIFFRDGTVKSSVSYSFAWRIAGTILISERIVRVPSREDLADSSRDEIVRLDTSELVLRDLSNNIVVYYKRLK